MPSQKHEKQRTGNRSPEKSGILFPSPNERNPMLFADEFSRMLAAIDPQTAIVACSEPYDEVYYPAFAFLAPVAIHPDLETYTIKTRYGFYPYMTEGTALVISHDPYRPDYSPGTITSPMTAATLVELIASIPDPDKTAVVTDAYPQSPNTYLAQADLSLMALRGQEFREIVRNKPLPETTAQAVMVTVARYILEDFC